MQTGIKNNVIDRLPTGLGLDFDEFIDALDFLEADAAKRKLKGLAILTATRKMVMSKAVPGREAVLFDWDRIFPDAKTIKTPAAWATDKKLMDAAAVIRKAGNIKIDDRNVDMHYLLAALEARLRNATVASPDERIKPGTAEEIASYHGTLAHSVFGYMQKEFRAGDKGWKVNKKLANLYHSQLSGQEKLNAFADAMNMEFRNELSASMNLLNYYTDKKGLVAHSMQNYAKKIGLGELKKNAFTNDTKELRAKQAQKILATSFLYGIDNGKTTEVNAMLREGDANAAYSAYMTTASNMVDAFVDSLVELTTIEVTVPSIISWNRLEPRPRTNDFKRVLRAEIRDALWMLSRQWQMGEFAAEDTGTCVEMRMDIGASQIGKYSLRRQQARNFDNTQPMETIVEREAVTPDLTLRLEMGRHWLRMLEAKLAADPTPIAPAVITGILHDFIAHATLHFSLPVPGSNFPEIYSDASLLHWYAAVSGGRAIDGYVLYQALKSNTQAASYLSSGSAAIKQLVNTAAAEFTAWFERIYSQPADAAETAWDASHLEYQFHCSSPDSVSTTTVLAADEYASGHLDWYNFDIETQSSNYTGGLMGGYSPDKVSRRVLTVLPTDVQFPGMPQSRWWQFEDYKIDLGGITGDTSEPAKLLIAEFALIFSNDWMLVPFTIDSGNICAVQSIIVKDVFGQHIQVRAAGAADTNDWQKWTMFNLKRRNYTGSAADTRLFLPPTTVTVMESDPVESVNFLRDEMANLVWGIETIIPDGKGGSREGWDAGRRLFNYLQSITVAPPVAPPAANNATVEYELATTVPEHWIPFIPVRLNAVTNHEIQLQRAAMPRIIPGRAVERVRPRTSLLRTGYNPSTGAWLPYRVFEEEVLRSGSIVESTWQRTRWTDGSVITWRGRRKYTGKGEADSGLSFDNVKDRK